MQEFMVFSFITLLILTAIVVANGLFVVEQQSVAIIERFGKFVRTAAPGLHFKIPFVETICGRINMRVMQLNLEVETKTLDDVFIKINTSVQYRILPHKIYEAFYTLDNAEKQIQSYVFDVVRARVPHTKLDDVFSRKDEIANAVCGELQEVMAEFGYNILKALVTDIYPDAKVKAAMNEINEAQRLRIAAHERGEAEKILKIKAAEGEAESKILQGKGMAGQRKAIIEGLQDSLTTFQHTIKDTSTHEVMSLMLMTQYFDTLKELGTHGRMNTILIPHSPGGMQDVFQQLRNTLLSSQAAQANPSAVPDSSSDHPN